MGRYGATARSEVKTRCGARSKILDGPDKGQPGDQCKLAALPGTQFCRRHSSNGEGIER